MSPMERMVLLTAAVFLLFKAVTFRRAPGLRGIGYLLLWPGMDPGPFLRAAPPSGPGLAGWGAVKALVGLCLVFLRTGEPVVDVALVMLGAFFAVHLGFCDVLAGAWRMGGVRVERLFPNPAASASLGEFWGRRWNRAFHVVARSFVYRPVSRRWGRGWGLAATFLFSGLLHDLLLSVPVGGGYGLPTLYFLIHGGLVGAERRWGLRGHVWTLFWVLAPLPLLFHPWFVAGIVLPYL